MKFLSLIFVILLLTSCSSTQLVERWKNPEIDIYVPSKILVVGLTSDHTARTAFENQLKNELELRGAEVVMSLNMFKGQSGSEKMNEEDLEDLENQLTDEGFDTILLTEIVGIENKVVHRRDYRKHIQLSRSFEEEYLMQKQWHFDADEYEEYQIYKAETLMYCICPIKDRELLWKGYINISDPQSVHKTVDDYVKLVIAALEQEQLILSKPAENLE